MSAISGSAAENQESDSGRPSSSPRKFNWRRIFAVSVALMLLFSIFLNFLQWKITTTFLSSTAGPAEVYHSGDKTKSDKLVIIEITGTIMPPFTERTLKSIKAAKEDKHVKGVLLAIDSPGGLVADSHQIYHRLKELAEVKPIIVSMKSMAASGGYYVAMGAGPKARIYAEPITWTGSIGVIIPRYELIGLKEKLGIESKPLKTGEFKDALNPFLPLTDREKAVWDNILNQSFDRFLTVIDENRSGLTKEQVRKLATGQIYTADDALKFGLIDAIGYEEDVLKELELLAKVSHPKVIKYQPASGWIDLVLASKAQADPAAQMRAWLELSVPRAMYYFSWMPPIPK